MALAISLILFAIFVSSVALGALADSAFMGDVGEMIVLLAASLAFVVAILKSEEKAAAAKNNQSN